MIIQKQLYYKVKRVNDSNFEYMTSTEITVNHISIYKLIIYNK